MPWGGCIMALISYYLKAFYALSLSSWCMITRMRCAHKMLVGYITSRLCLRWSSPDYLFAVYRVACVLLAHSSVGDWRDILICNPSYHHQIQIQIQIQIKILNLNLNPNPYYHQIGSVNLSHCCHIFPCMVVCLMWLYNHILSFIIYIFLSLSVSLSIISYIYYHIYKWYNIIIFHNLILVEYDDVIL